MPNLYIVATPIGNLEDITLRALRTLREVKLIAAEDTRKTRRLLTKYDIKTPTTSYYEHNKWEKMDYIFSCLEKEDVALVSEAGMPGISDPGHELIVAAGEKGIPVVPIPGPSVVVTAVAVSGLPTDRFTFIGFLPRRTAARRELLESIAAEPGSVVILEAPHRLLATLHDMLAVLGNRRMTVCRELTKIHEEVFRGTIEDAINRFAEPRGEFTLVVAGKIAEEKGKLEPGDIEKRLRELQRAGMSAREASITVAGETGLPRKEIYRAWLNISGPGRS